MQIEHMPEVHPLYEFVVTAVQCPLEASALAQGMTLLRGREHDTAIQAFTGGRVGGPGTIVATRA
jgi:hypothetical protein